MSPRGGKIPNFFLFEKQHLMLNDELFLKQDRWTNTTVDIAVERSNVLVAQWKKCNSQSRGASHPNSIKVSPLFRNLCKWYMGLMH